MPFDSKGFANLDSRLTALSRLEFRAATLEGAEAMLKRMQPLTPVDTGELLDSEHVELQEDGALVIAGTDHAIFVEFGTRNMAAQPYMRPAIDTARRSIADRITAAVLKIIRSVIR